MRPWAASPLAAVFMEARLIAILVGATTTFSRPSGSGDRPISQRPYPTSLLTPTVTMAIISLVAQ